MCNFLQGIFSPFALFLLAIALSVLRLAASHYLLAMFKFFFLSSFRGALVVVIVR
jgi:hypothetical protein